MNITDNRRTFSKSSFSNLKKNKIIEHCIRAFYYDNVKEALFFTAEMMCSLYINDLWKIYIQFYCKYIHVHNIKMAIYLKHKFEEFKSIAKTINNDFEIRNHPKMRHLFFTLSILFCKIKKENALSTISIDFSIEKMNDNLCADDIEYIKPYFRENDPREFYIPLNEFAYHIEKTKNIKQIFYWIDWIIDYDWFLIKKKKQVFIEERSFVELNQRKNHNIIWFIWDILIQKSKTYHGMIHKTIWCLLELFQIKYNHCNNRAYKCILYVGCSLLIETNIQTDIKLIDNMNIFKDMDDKIKEIFSEIKKKEIWIEEPKSEKQKLYDSVYKI